jgi:hypothetical protein
MLNCARANVNAKRKSEGINYLKFDRKIISRNLENTHPMTGGASPKKYINVSREWRICSFSEGEKEFLKGRY